MSICGCSRLELCVASLEALYLLLFNQLKTNLGLAVAVVIVGTQQIAYQSGFLMSSTVLKL